MTTTTNKSPSSECCIIASTGLCATSLVVSFIFYIVFAILYLVQDYNVWNDCESNSYLWPYVLVAIILSLNKSNVKNSGDEDQLAIIIAGFILEFGLMCWGGVELFNKLDNCQDLRDSNLWKVGLTTFILQLLFCIILLCIPLMMYFANKSSVNKNAINISVKNTPTQSSNV